MIQSLPRISKYVFPSDTNKDVHMGNPQLGVMVKRRAEAAEITKKMEPYIFRRTWLTLAVQSGMPMPDAKKIMGHKDINTTARYYNSDDAQQRKAMMLHKLNRKDVSFKTIKAMAAERLGDLTDGTSAEWSVTSEGDGYMNIRISVV